MLYWLFIIDAILMGTMLIILIIGSIKVFFYAKEYYNIRRDHKQAQEEESSRITKILKYEYLTAKETNDIKTMKTIIKINNQIKENKEKEK